MSCVCILTPVVIAAWPSLSATVVAAAASLGYGVVKGIQDITETDEKSNLGPKSVQLEIANSQVVTQRLGRDDTITVARDGITITFARDARGRASFCVTGEGNESELRAQGEALSQRVVQQFVYDKLKHELQSRQYLLVEEEIDETRAIRLKVRHWEE